jgi:gamma-glutamylaminecyclotransferase
MDHLIFTYGTLKQGHPNFHVNRGTRVPGVFVTVERYPLWILGDTHLPWLVQQPGHGHAVAGELYRVDDAGLAAMDALEQIDEPGWYERLRIRVRPREGGEAVETWVYFGTAGRAETETIHAGPLAEYTLQHALSYRHVG